jgi:hypothetical protein
MATVKSEQKTNIEIEKNSFFILIFLFCLDFNKKINFYLYKKYYHY